MPVTVIPYSHCGKCSACRAGRTNSCANNRTLGVQRDGAFTEFISVPFETVLPVERLSAAEAALIEPLSVGFHAVSRGRITEADTVVVIGAGMIGLGAIAGAGLRQGARVIAVDIDDAKLALARKAGASEVVNSRSGPLHERLRELTGGNGSSVVIEAVGLPETFVAAVNVVCFAGRVVYIGYAKEPVSYETRFFVMKELDILGSRNATRQDFEDVMSMLRSGRYPVAETITRTVPFVQAGDALREWAENPSRVSKIHVTLD